MSRKRMIDPEYWADEKISTLSMGARLLFIGLWNFADDEGIVRFHEAYLRSSIFPYDNLSPQQIKEYMEEIVKTELIYVYRGGLTNQFYGYIINFLKYQKINRPQPSKLPPPSLQNKKTIVMYAKRDGMKCHLCGEGVELLGNGTKPNSKEASPDHITPRSKGGSDYPSNIAISHVSCNKGRGNADMKTNTSEVENIDMNEEWNNSMSNSVNNSRLIEKKRIEKKRRERVSEFNSLNSLTKPILQKIANDYSVTLTDVEFTLEQLKNYQKVDSYKDYNKALRNWVLKKISDGKLKQKFEAKTKIQEIEEKRKDKSWKPDPSNPF